MPLRSAADSEWVTRKDLVDKELRDVRWRVASCREGLLTAFAVEECMRGTS